MNERILVTGATGLVGYHVCKNLRSSYQVLAAVRASSNTEQLKQLQSEGNLQIVTVDLHNPSALEQSLEGCAAVVHCAGSVDMSASKEAIFKTNVEGTKNLIQAAVKAGVKQFVHISSLSVITGQSDQFDVDETAPLRHSAEPYADSKVTAEEVVRQECASMPFTILRPGFIYGPFERAWLPRLIANIKNGKAMLIDGGQRATNVIYVENLSKAVALSLYNKRAEGQVYNLTDGQTPNKKELFDAICEGLSLPRVKKSVPRPVAQGVCQLVSLVSPLLSAQARQGLSRFSPGAFRLAAINQGFSCAKAERELGYTDRIPFAEGMAATLKHFRSDAGAGCSAPPAMAAR